MMHLKILLSLLFSVSVLEAVPILMSWSSSLKLLESEHTSNITSVTSTTHLAIAVDYHYKRGEVYFSDGSGHICRAWLKKEGITRDPIVIAEVMLVDGLAVDWVNDNLYWADMTKKVVEMATLDGLKRRVLFSAKDGVDKPRAVVVDPSEGLLFWSDWGINGRVSSSGLDGKGNRTVSTHFIWPNGLALDLNRKKLYVLDGLLSSLYSCNYDGTSFTKILQHTTFALQAFGLSYYSNNLYWTSWKEKALVSLDISLEQATVIYRHNKFGGATERMMGLKTMHPSLQPEMPQAISCDKRCSHQCLPGRERKASCVCPFGFSLEADETNCVEKGYLLISWRRTIRRIDLDGKKDQPMIDSTKAAISIDFHYNKSLVFWSDIEEHRIYRAPLEQLNNHTLVASVESCDGLVVDWVHDVIYWTDISVNVLEVASLDGSNRRVLIKEELDEPRALALDPFEGALFWSDWGTNPKIERAHLDGSNRKAIITDNVVWPNGITIDLDQRRLYWTDGKLALISSCLYDGSQRTHILGSLLASLQPFAISLFQDYLYWTDWNSKSLMKVEKNNRTSYISLLANSSTAFVRPNGIKVVHSSLQRDQANPCSAIKCRGLCLGSPESRWKARCMDGETESDIIFPKEEDDFSECEREELICDGKKDCPNGKDEDLNICAGIENIIVHKRTKTEAYFRIDVTKRTVKHLVKFSVNYKVAESKKEETIQIPAEQCKIWPESYCFNVSSLNNSTLYIFDVSTVLKNGVIGNPESTSVFTKEGVPGPPEDIRVVGYTPTSVEIQWHHPNQSNGIIRNFIININEVEAFEEDKCCLSFPMTEVPVEEEAPIYSNKPSGFSPATTYAISITSKTLYLGGSKEIDVHTPPPPMEILRMPELAVSSLTPISWRSRNDLFLNQPQYQALIKYYLLILLPPKADRQSTFLGESDIEIRPVKSLLEKMIGTGFSVISKTNVNDEEGFKEPIRVGDLTHRKQYELVWVQVSQYKDVYGVDYIISDPFIAV